jgi:hypothetical protein
MDQIVNILNKEKGTTFNPILVENFLEIVAPELTKTLSAAGIEAKVILPVPPTDLASPLPKNPVLSP